MANEEATRLINLCDTCVHGCPAQCPGEEIEYGEGVGNDNVIKCDGYQEKK